MMDYVWDDDDDLEENSFEESRSDGDVVPRNIGEDGCRQLLMRFFNDQQMHYGGPITAEVLYHPENVQIVQYMEFQQAVPIFYQCLKDNGIPGGKDQYKMLIKLQEEAHRKEIPKQYSGGILLVYLKLCKGYDI